MIIRSLLSTIPFVLVNLRAPDIEGGGGNPPADQSPFSVAEAPAITGDSLENKVTSAVGIIKSLFEAGKGLLSRLSTSENERTKLEGQFNAATSDLTKEKEKVTSLNTQLSTLNTQVTGLTTERDNSNKNVERLEKLCNLRGIDPNTVVPANDKPEGAAGNVWEQYQGIRAQEKAGTAKPGTAHAFYQKNSKALHEYQNAHKSE